MIDFRDDQEREDILRDMQVNMNEEIRAALQYICHRIAARGQNSLLADSFKSASLDEMAHILYFSDLITKYGGSPVFTDWDIDKSGDLKTMLEKDLLLETEALGRYAAQIERMKDHPELVSLLKSVRDDEEDHRDEFAGYLEKI